MMNPKERQFALDQLASSEVRVLELVDGLTPEQWSFRETPERWSIAENMEHLLVFEEFLMGVIARVLDGPEELEKKAAVAAKEPLVLRVGSARHVRFDAREVMRPTGRWADAAEMVEEFRKARARTIAFAAETEADLRGHFFPHIAFGDLDCYQWVVLIGQHTARHVLQIQEIQADAAYPAA